MRALSLPISTFHYLKSSFLAQISLNKFSYGFGLSEKEVLLPESDFLQVAGWPASNISSNQTLCNNFTDTEAIVSEKAIDTKVLVSRIEFLVLLYWQGGEWWILQPLEDVQQFNFRVKTPNDKVLNALNWKVLFIRNCDSWNYLPGLN